MTLHSDLHLMESYVIDSCMREELEKSKNPSLKLNELKNFVLGFMGQVTKSAVIYKSDIISGVLLGTDTNNDLKGEYHALEFVFSEGCRAKLNTLAANFLVTHSLDSHVKSLLSDPSEPSRAQAFKMSGRDFLFSCKGDPRSFWAQDFKDSKMLYYCTKNIDQISVLGSIRKYDSPDGKFYSFFVNVS